MSIIRVNKNKENPYVMINKGFLEDSNLSFKAKGILTYLLSKPDNWSCQVKDLQNKGKDGRDSIYNGLKELREHGYLIKKPLRDKEGKIKEWEEEVFEVPQIKAKEVYKKQVNSRSLTIYGKSVKGKTVKGKPVNIISNEFNNNEFNNNNTNTTQQVVSSKNKDLIETYTHIQLSSNMSRQVISWSYERLEQAIRIFNKQEGEYFALLKRIYEDDGNFAKKNIPSCGDEEINAKSFNNFPAREYDYDKLERLEQAIRIFNKQEGEYFALLKRIYEDDGNFIKKNIPSCADEEIDPKSFNNFPAREYDYDNLERRLLGWDNEQN